MCVALVILQCLPAQRVHVKVLCDHHKAQITLAHKMKKNKVYTSCFCMMQTIQGNRHNAFICIYALSVNYLRCIGVHDAERHCFAQINATTYINRHDVKSTSSKKLYQKKKEENREREDKLFYLFTYLFSIILF